jgi:hypothetical protein
MPGLSALDTATALASSLIWSWSIIGQDYHETGKPLSDGGKPTA